MTSSRFLPPPWYEYAFYVQVFYATMGPAIGISIPLFGIGMLVVIGGLSLIRMGRHWTMLLAPIAIPMACGVSFVAVQVVVFGNSLGGGYTREFVPWMLSLVVIQYLALRPGFFHRFAMMIFLIGLSTLPFLRSFAGDASRSGLAKGITIGNPNDLGAWFGFCCVYFTILGLEIRRNWVRVTSWLAAGGCLLVVGLTVSRTPLFAVAVSIVFAFRRVLKRGFVPLMVLAVLVWVAYALGLFDRAAASYAQRGLEETGRFIVWPMAIRRFLESPFVGVGVHHLATSIPQAEVAIEPHNGAIFIGLASGIVPLMFFTAYWVQLFATTMKAGMRSHVETPFQSALLIYSFLIAMNLNLGFMVPWMMGIFATITATGLLVQARMSVAGRPLATQASSAGRLQPDGSRA